METSSPYAWPAPDPEFLVKLALPHASILPEAAGDREAGTTPAPGTGPYRLVSYDPNDRLRIERNPHFTAWNPDAQPDGFVDRIEYEFGLEDTAALTAILNGDADWMFDAPPADRLGALGAQHPHLVHLNPAFATWFLPMNTRLPPFDDVRVRQALNLAVDRRAAVRLFGGPRLAVPLCQVLPPGLAGHEPYCPFAPPDLPRARRLVADAGAAGQAVTLVTDDSPVARAIGTYMLDVLADLGFRPRLRALSGNVQFTYIQNTRNAVQLSLTNWYGDYPSASNFLGGIYGCAAFRPGSDASPNISGYCDEAVDKGLADALAMGAARALATLDRTVTDAAPAVVLFSPRYIDVVSSRVGGYAYHEQFRWLIGQAWIKR